MPTLSPRTDRLPAGGVAVEVASSLPSSEAARRVDGLGSERLSEDPPLRVVADVHDPAVHLRVCSASSWPRRKSYSWNVEFDGTIVPTSAGSILRGRIDLPDRTQVDLVLIGFGLIVLVAAFIWAATKPPGELALADIAGDIIFVGLVWAFLALLRDSGVRSAGRDATILEAGLRRVMAEP